MGLFLLASLAFVVGENLPVSAQSAPTVSRVSPSSGPLVGGQIVVITGKDFTGASAVKFGAGGTDATNFAVMNDKQIVATVPNASAAAKLLVEVTTTAGANTTGGTYEYKAPKITKVEPAFAKKDDDNFITITGEGLLGTQAADVAFGSDDAAAVWVISDKQIVVQPAKHDGSTVTITDGVTDVVVTRNSVATTPDDDSKFLFTDGVPTITSLTDGSSTVTGTDDVAVGATLTINGTRLWGLSQVNFGTTKVTNSADITVNAGGTVATVKVPSRSAGPTDVTVTNASGTSLTTLGTVFSFFSTNAPKVTTIYPEALANAAGGTVLVTGSGLTGVGTSHVTLTCTNSQTATASSAVSISDKSLILTLSATSTPSAAVCTVTIENPTDNTLVSTGYDVRYL